MSATGSLNTLSTKVCAAASVLCVLIVVLTVQLADVSPSPGLDGEPNEFNHPFVQALGMFFGECLCMVAFRYTLYKERAENRVVEVTTDSRRCQLPDVPLAYSQRKAFSPIIFLAPACCDLCATSLMYVGLTLTFGKCCLPATSTILTPICAPRSVRVPNAPRRCAAVHGHPLGAVPGS